MNDVLTRINVMLAERNLKAIDMCQKIGLAPTTFYTWRKTDRIPGSEYLPSIAKYLGVSIDYLLTGETPDFTVYLDDATKILVESVKHLTAGEKIYLSKIARFIETEKAIEQENSNEEV